MNMEQVAIFNANYELISFVPWTKAMKLLIKGKAEVLKYSDKIIKSCDKHFKLPLALKLVKLIRSIYKNQIMFTRNGVFIRDEHICQYCGIFSNKLTIDHVIPVSKGGQSTWENCVAACFDCNKTKGNKSCSEAKMFPKHKPIQPTVMEFIMKRFKSPQLKELLEEIFVGS